MSITEPQTMTNAWNSLLRQAGSHIDWNEALGVLITSDGQFTQESETSLRCNICFATMIRHVCCHQCSGPLAAGF